VPIYNNGGRNNMSFVEMNVNNQQRPDGIPCLLIYGFNTEEIAAIKSIVNTLAIEKIMCITTDMQENVIEDILNDNIIRNPLLKPIDERVVILNDLSDYDVHELINAFKKAGLPRPIYAVGTKASRKWTFHTWLLELQEERAAMIELGLKKRGK